MKPNLVMGQWTASDLSHVTVLSSNALTNEVLTSAPFYQQTRIDPKGELFGNTACGLLNYTRYMQWRCNR